MTKKDKAFKLFNEGKNASSPEVKALKLRGRTKYNYYLEWQKRGGGTAPSSTLASEAKGKGKVISELEMLVPAGEVKPEEGEPKTPEMLDDTPEPLDDTPEPLDDTPVPPAESEEKPKEKPSTDGKKALPTMVAGQSLTFAISISVKTLMLYQIAASMQEEELTLGDFVDVCVEDTYQGRGFDVGLIKTGGEQ